MRTADGKDVRLLDLEFLDMRFFGWHEVACQHTGLLPPSFALVSDEFHFLVDMLTYIRGAEPLAISSWYRDRSHPIEAKKGLPGAHSTGLAADLRVSGGRAFDAIAGAIDYAQSKSMGERLRIGVNQKGTQSQRFVHLDVAAPHSRIWMTGSDYAYRREFVAPTIWSY